MGATILGTRHGRVDDTEDIIKIANLLVEDEVFVNKPGRSFTGLGSTKVMVEASLFPSSKRFYEIILLSLLIKLLIVLFLDL